MKVSLSRNICYACCKEFGSESQERYFDMRWNSGYVNCPNGLVGGHSTTTVKTKNDILPSFCPYSVEIVVQQE